MTTAANCCRNIPLDVFSTVRDVMPNLLNVLNSNDHGVMEQASLCVSRIVESFKYEHEKLESLVSTDLLKAIRRLLLPSAVNMISPNIHTQFLRVLSNTARASPKLSAELIKMGIVDTLYQILTGVSPANDWDNITASIDSVLIMQSLIHRPRDQVYETLNVISELLPGIQQRDSPILDRLLGIMADDIIVSSRTYADATDARRLEMLQDNKHDLMRFAVIVFPTLTDAYSSTVNLSVRQKVLTVQLKMLSNFDVDILERALRSMQYASFLASILSQQDHTSLVIPALEAAEFLMIRMEAVYSYQFHREGVIAEIKKLSERSFKNEALAVKMKEAVHGSGNVDEILPHRSSNIGSKQSSPNDTTYHAVGGEAHESGEDEDEDDVGHEEDDEDGDDFDGMEEDSGDIERVSRSSSESSDSERKFFERNPVPDLQDLITIRAQHFLDTYLGPKTKEMGEKAELILQDLQGLAKDIENCHPSRGSAAAYKLFSRLCKYFSTDETENVTSAELLRADLARSLVESLHHGNGNSLSAFPYYNLLTVASEISSKRQDCFPKSLHEPPSECKVWKIFNEKSRHTFQCSRA